MALTALSFFFGLFQRDGIVLGVALILYAAYLFLIGRSIANGLQVRRSVTARALEGENIGVTISIENSGAFTARDFLVSDSFTGCVDSDTIIWVGKSIAPGNVHEENYKKHCNAGMGIYEFKPLMICVTDPLGIFEFYITEDQKNFVSVYPVLEAIPELILVGSKESFVHGLFEVQAKGGALNFTGIREYSRGDSLRHIAWKPSARNSKLMVKEFEKVVDTSVTVLMELNGRFHVGNKASSTWSYTKRVALGIISQQIVNGNSVQMFSNEKMIPLGRGDDHFHWIVSEVFGLSPLVDEKEGTLMSRYSELIPMGSNAIYICPSMGGNSFLSVLQSIFELSQREINVICIVVDSLSFVPVQIEANTRMAIAANLQNTKALIKKYSETLVENNVAVYLVENKKNIGEAFLKNLAFSGAK